MIEDPLLYLTHYNQNINIGFPEEKVNDEIKMALNDSIWPLL